jgi:glutamyl-tRNA synthetase
MLAFLGWNPGTPQEIFSLEELCEAFSLDRVSKAGAKFDPDKTKWFQQQHLRAKDNSELAQELKAVLGSDLSIEALTIISGLMKERATFIQDIESEGDFLFAAPTSYDQKTVSKKWKEEAPALMTEWMTVIESIASFDAETIEMEFKSFVESKELGLGRVLPLFRLLITGKGMGPSMFEISAFLGKETCIARMKGGIEAIAQVQQA